MKKLITLTLLSACFAISAFAQQKSITNLHKKSEPSFRPRAAQRGTAVVSGLLYPESFSSGSSCLTTIGIYTSDVDYMVGNNTYGDKEFLMRYDLSEYGAGLPATVDTVVAEIGYKYQGGNGSVRAKVYADDGTGAPGALLGTSVAKTVSQISDTTDDNFIFTTPVSITTNKFFVAIDASSLYATGDTVALYSTDGECTSTDQTAAWTKTDNNSFIAFSADLNDGGWASALDLGIFAAITANQLAINNVVKNNFSAHAYPVPANNTVTISFTGQDNDNTTLNFKDITGKTISTSSLKTIKGSNYKVPFNVNNLSSGMYFVEIASGINKGMIKVSVQ